MFYFSVLWSSWSNRNHSLVWMFLCEEAADRSNVLKSHNCVLKSSVAFVKPSSNCNIACVGSGTSHGLWIEVQACVSEINIDFKVTTGYLVISESPGKNIRLIIGECATSHEAGVCILMFLPAANQIHNFFLFRLWTPPLEFTKAGCYDNHTFTWVKFPCQLNN